MPFRRENRICRPPASHAGLVDPVVLAALGGMLMGLVSVRWR